MNRELVSQLEPLVERLEGWRGSAVEVVEEITRSPGTLDRHFATRSSLVMRLEHVALTFSGAALTLLGKADGRDVGYQAACELLDRVAAADGEVVLVERFGRAAERHTTIRPLDDGDRDQG